MKRVGQVVDDSLPLIVYFLNDVFTFLYAALVFCQLVLSSFTFMLFLVSPVEISHRSRKTAHRYESPLRKALPVC